jgi:hypothetical protein
VPREGLMKRLSRSRVINDIELIVKASVVGLGKHRWETRGVECVLDRHSYHGEIYSFDVEVLRIERNAAGRRKWQVYVVTEFWRTQGDENARMTKWLKLTAGKSTDVVSWIVENREAAAGKK